MKKKKTHLGPKRRFWCHWAHFCCSALSCLLIHWSGSNIIATHAGLLKSAIASSGEGRGVRKTLESLASFKSTLIMWFVEGGLKWLRKLKKFKSFEPTLNMTMWLLFALAENHISFFFLDAWRHLKCSLYTLHT